MVWNPKQPALQWLLQQEVILVQCFFHDDTVYQYQPFRNGELHHVQFQHEVQTFINQAMAEKSSINAIRIMDQ